MRELDYRLPDDAAGAVATVSADPEAAFLAGGTNLVDHLKLGIATPATLVDVRRLIYDLRPMSLDDLGFLPTLERYLHQTEEYTTIKTRLNYRGSRARLPEKLEINVFRLTFASCGTATARCARVPVAVMRMRAARAKESTTGTFSTAGEDTAALKGTPKGGWRGRGQTLTLPAAAPRTGHGGHMRWINYPEGGCRPAAGPLW